MDDTRNLTFKEMYQRANVKPMRDFLSEMAAVAHCSEMSIRRWGIGVNEPDELTKVTLANHFGTTVEALFPGTGGKGSKEGNDNNNKGKEDKG